MREQDDAAAHSDSAAASFPDIEELVHRSRAAISASMAVLKRLAEAQKKEAGEQPEL